MAQVADLRVAKCPHDTYSFLNGAVISGFNPLKNSLVLSLYVYIYIILLYILI